MSQNSVRHEMLPSKSEQVALNQPLLLKLAAAECDAKLCAILTWDLTFKVDY